MTAYLTKRLAQLPVTLLVIVTTVFFVLHSTGNLIALLLPLDATPQQRAEVAHQLHLDEPLPQQFGYYLANLVHGDLGRSVFYQRPAGAVVLERLPATVELAATGIGIAIVVGVLLGIVAAARPGSLQDLVIGIGTVFGQSMPSFWLGMMLILGLAVDVHWLPTSGVGGPTHLVLPAITLAAFLVPQILLLTRSSMLDVLGEQYITTARSKGLHHRVLLVKHALRNALTPVVASVGLQFGTLAGGAVLTETVFAWPGVGRLSVEAILNRDVPVVEACVIVLALGVMLSNLAVDLASAWLDPRIRMG